jgi:hypothetical protein
VATLRGGKIKDLSKTPHKQAAFMIMATLDDPPREFVGSWAATHHEPKPAVDPRPAPRTKATDLDPAEMRARIAAREPMVEPLAVGPVP